MRRFRRLSDGAEFNEPQAGLLMSNTDLSQGFDAGNYAAAYETSDYSEAIARLSLNRSPAYHVAFTLGFFSSYTLEEIGEDLDAYMRALGSPAGKRCLELGYLDLEESKHA